MGKLRPGGGRGLAADPGPRPLFGPQLAGRRGSVRPDLSPTPPARPCLGPLPLRSAARGASVLPGSSLGPLSFNPRLLSTRCVPSTALGAAGAALNTALEGHKQRSGSDQGLL